MNRLCRDTSHHWMYVANDTSRYCRREGCRASERLVNGQWVSTLPLYRRHRSVLPSSYRQASLFETPTKEG